MAAAQSTAGKLWKLTWVLFNSRWLIELRQLTTAADYSLRLPHTSHTQGYSGVLFWRPGSFEWQLKAFFLLLQYAINQWQISSSVLQSDRVLHCLRSFRSTCWVGFVMTLCWNTFRCTVSPRGPPPPRQRWCNCLSIGRGRVTWSTTDSCTATRQTRPTKYWRCVKMIQSRIACFLSEIYLLAFDCIARCMRVEWVETAK